MKDGLSRRELMKVLGAMPLVGGMIGEVEAAPARKEEGCRNAKRECFPNRFGEPTGCPLIWIDGHWHGQLTGAETKNCFVSLKELSCISLRPGYRRDYVNLWWHGAALPHKVFHEFRSIMVKLQTDDERLVFLADPLSQSFYDDHSISLLLKMTVILEFSSP